jgi:hypothetical protein
MLLAELPQAGPATWSAEAVSAAPPASETEAAVGLGAVAEDFAAVVEDSAAAVGEVVVDEVADAGGNRRRIIR